VLTNKHKHTNWRAAENNSPRYAVASRLATATTHRWCDARGTVHLFCTVSVSKTEIWVTMRHSGRDWCAPLLSLLKHSSSNISLVIDSPFGLSSVACRQISLTTVSTINATPDRAGRNQARIEDLRSRAILALVEMPGCFLRADVRSDQIKARCGQVS